MLRVGDNGNFVFGLAKTYIQSRSDCFTNQHIYITSDEEIKERDWVIAIEGIWKNTITKITGTPITDVWRKIILTTDYDLIAEGVQAIDDEFLWWFSENPSCERAEVVKGKMQLNDDGQEYGFPDMSLYKIIIPQEEPKQEWNPTQGEEVWIKVFSNWSKGIYIGYDVTKETHIVREDDEGGGHLMSSSQVLPYCEMPNEPKQETLEEAAEKLYLSHENNELLYGHSEDLQLAYKAGILDGAKWQAERIPSIIEEYLETAFISKEQGYMNPQKWFEQFKKK